MKMGKYILAALFGISLFSYSHSAFAATITKDQLDQIVKEAEANTKKTDVDNVTQEVLAAEAKGTYKFPIPSADQAANACTKIGDIVDKDRGAGSYINDLPIEDACDSWSQATRALENTIKHRYEVLAEVNSGTQYANCINSGQGPTGIACLPTPDQVKELQNNVTSARSTMYAAITTNNADSAKSAAEARLEESGCRVASTNDAEVTDSPSPEFAKANPGVTCDQLRSDVASAGAQADQAQQAQDQQGGGSGGCSFTDPTSWATTCIANIFMDTIGMFILTLANFFLALAGILFNLVIVKTVFEFGNIIGNSEGLLLAWGILRDIGNMALLFGFIFMGIAMILDLHSFPVKKALPRLLIFAILMNFSLFAAEAVIDVSNAVSVAMYNTANTDSCLGSWGTNECLVQVGLAGNIMKMTGLSTMWSISGNGVTGANKGVTYIMLALLATIGAVVFMAAAIMLIVRLIILTIIMIFSPIGFAGMAIPPLEKYARMWWDKLIAQSFFAPAMILLMLVSLKVTEVFKVGAEGNGIAGAIANPNASATSIILVFAIVIGFMIASLVIAKKMGAGGAQFAINAGKGAVLGTYGGVSGIAGRRTIGAGSSALQKKYNAWMGSGDTHSGIRKALINTKLDDAIGKSLKSGQSARFGSSTSFKENKEHHEARDKELKKAAQTAQKSKAIKDASDEKAMSAALKGMNETELSELGSLKNDPAKRDLIAKSLSAETFDKLMKKDSVTPDIREKMAEARFRSLTEGIANNDGSEIKKWSAKDLETFASYNSTAFEALIKATGSNGESLISNEQFEALNKSTHLNNSQKQLVKDNSNSSRIGSLVTTDVSAAKKIIDSLSGGKAVAKLSGDVLTHPDVAKELTVAQLQAIMTEDKLTKKQLGALSTIIKNRAQSENAIKDFIDPQKNALAAAYFA